MYPYLERTADVAPDQCETFLIEAERFPRHVPDLNAALEDVSLRGCFMGQVTYSPEPYIDVGELGFDAAMDPAERSLFGETFIR
jgi:hypothetical protein